MPSQLALLQAVITLRLAADRNAVHLSTADVQLLANELFDAYQGARLGQGSRPASAKRSVLNAPDKTARLYETILGRYTEHGRFRLQPVAPASAPREALVPAGQRREEFAVALFQALFSSENMTVAFRPCTLSQMRSCITDVARLVNESPAEPHGLTRYLVLLDRPLKGIDHDVILLLEQHIPAAAERQRVAPAGRPSAAWRAGEDVKETAGRRSLLNNWCDLAGGSYRIRLLDPAAQTLRCEQLRDLESLREAAQLLGDLLGDSHCRDRKAAKVPDRLDAPARAEILDRSERYLAQLTKDFDEFSADPRVHAHATRFATAARALNTNTLSGRRRHRS